MIEGVEILSQTNVYEYTASSWLILLFLTIGFIVGLVIAVIECINYGFDSDVICVVVYCTLIGLGIGFIGFLLSIEPTDTVDHIEYKVTISDTVNFNEFTDKYEILDQEGKIYTIREREE
jgi:uncharacterized protein YacL